MQNLQGWQLIRLTQKNPNRWTQQKTIEKFYEIKFQQVHPVTGQTSKKIGAIKEAVPEAHHHVITEL